MFHISFLVRDKHLAEVLRSLENRVMNLEVQPTKHSEKDEITERKKKIPADAIERTIAEFAKDGDIFSVGAVARTCGCSSSGAARAVAQAEQSGFIVRVGKEGREHMYVRKETLANVS